MTAKRNPHQAAEQHCWTQIGIWGDRSCSELVRVGHCRNCEVYGSGSNELFARPVPEDYLDRWTELLAAKQESATASSRPYLVFRIGSSWLGLRALTLREVVHPGVIRAIPHRRSNVLLGLTAVRGEIYPCVSMHALIGEPPIDAGAPGTRNLVAHYQGGNATQLRGIWVFPVDEVSGIYEVLDNGVEPLPATLTHTNANYTTGIAQCGDRPVGLLDEELIFSALQRRIT